MLGHLTILRGSHFLIFFEKNKAQFFFDEKIVSLLVYNRGPGGSHLFR